MDLLVERWRWLQPVSSFVTILLIRQLQFTIAELLIVLTPRKSLLRPASIPLQIALGAVAFPHVRRAIVEPISIHWRVLGGGTVALQTVLSIAVSSMIRLDDKDASALSKKPGLWNKLGALTDFLNNQRCLGTRHQIHWIPPFDENRPGYVPTRAEHLRTTVWQMVRGYVFRQLMVALLWQRIHMGLWFILYIGSWLNASYTFADLVALLSGAPVESRPPAFGSMRYTTTLRGFWGKYWHQSLRFPFQGAAYYFCKEFLGLRGVTQRYSNILFVFTLSGFFHILTDRAEGVSWEQSRSLRFFLMQPLGIVIEDGVQELWRRWHASGKKDTKGNREPDVEFPMWAKAVGYIWTWTFFCVTVKWFFDPHEDVFLQKHGAQWGIAKKLLSFLGMDAVSAYLPELQA